MSQRPRASRNPLTHYMQLKGHAYTFRTPDHGDTLQVRFHPGYIELYHPKQGNFYITRNAWIHVLRHALPLLKHMNQQFSVVRATARYMREEDKFLKTFRQEKRDRRRSQREIPRR